VENDEMVPKAVPKLVPQNANTLFLLGILQVIGGLLVPRRGIYFRTRSPLSACL
jgi:hypothetical protein